MKHLLLTAIFLLLPILVLGQAIEVSGTVFDDDTGMPIPGANIIEKGSTNGTMTDFDGNFNLKVSGSKSVIVISFIGYKNKEFTIGEQTNFDIKLTQEAGQLDEVVLIGYQAVHKRDLTGSVSSIKSDDIEGIPVTNVASLIATQSTGVQSINLSGAPGARSNLVIRGNTSISGDLNGNSVYTAFSSPYML